MRYGKLLKGFYEVRRGINSIKFKEMRGAEVGESRCRLRSAGRDKGKGGRLKD